MRILFFGRFDPHYSRNAVLMKGLRLNDAEVLECRVSPSARFWPLRLVWRYLRMRPRFDVMLVAFPGQEVMLLARWLTLKPIVFDAFTSHYEGYVEDRKAVAVDSLKARWFALLDRLACGMATVVLTDTRAHANYFHARFGVPQNKIHAILLGTMLAGIPPRASDAEFVAHFHGSNIPLQGIDIIWGAVRRLWNEQIRFQMIGPFTVPNELRAHVDHREYIPFTELAELMSRADVCLGIFGVSPKTQRVIPNKVYESLAASRPVITAGTPAIHELLNVSSAVFVPAGDADALAQAILKLKNDKELTGHIGAAGNEMLMKHAAPNLLGRQVADVIQSLI